MRRTQIVAAAACALAAVGCGQEFTLEDPGPGPCPGPELVEVGQAEYPAGTAEVPEPGPPPRRPDPGGEPRYEFFEAPLDGGPILVYEGTLDEFFGLRAARGSAFSGSFVPEGGLWPSTRPLERAEVDPDWARVGAEARRDDPAGEALWLRVVPHARQAGGAR